MFIRDKHNREWSIVEAGDVDAITLEIRDENQRVIIYFNRVFKAGSTYRDERYNLALSDGNTSTQVASLLEYPSAIEKKLIELLDRGR